MSTSSPILSARDKTEVFFNENGTITIRQDAMFFGEQIITILPEDVNHFIEMIQGAYEEAEVEVEEMECENAPF